MSLQDVLKSVSESIRFDKVAKINGIDYRLRVLSLEDEKLANAAISTMAEELEGNAYFSEMRKAILSRAIVGIGSEEIPETVAGEDGSTKDRPIFLRELLATFPNSIVEALFDVYIDLRDRTESSLRNEMKYDWFKTPEQREKEYEEKEKQAAEEAEKQEKEAEGETEKETQEAEEAEVEDVELRKVNEAREPELPPEAPAAQ